MRDITDVLMKRGYNEVRARIEGAKLLQFYKELKKFETVKEFTEVSGYSYPTCLKWVKILEECGLVNYKKKIRTINLEDA